MVDVAAYLRRINYLGSTTPTSDTLRQLQLSHLYSVPFENLSIHAGVPVILDEESLFHKIVKHRRGGFCYELNGLFASLLGRLGFEVTKVSARVMNPQGEFGPEFDHMALIVPLEQRWLVDVGFPGSVVEPLLVDERGEQIQQGRAHRIDAVGERLVLLERDEAGEWKPQYDFTLAPRETNDFADMCRFHQTSAESPFTHGRICSLATANGRVTVSDKQLIITKGTGREERELADDREYFTVLREYFGIDSVASMPERDEPSTVVSQANGARP